MRNALILHGIQGHAGIHWQQWLHGELVKRGYKVIMPDLPESEHPSRSEWLKVVKRLTRHINFSNLLIVGHSLSVVTALDLIEDKGEGVKTFISVSGFGKDYGAKLNSYFLKKRDIDFEKVRSLTKKTYVIYGDDDPYVPQKTLKDLADKLGVEPIIIKNGGHVNTDSGYDKLPVIIEILEKNE